MTMEILFKHQYYTHKKYEHMPALTDRNTGKTYFYVKDIAKREKCSHEKLFKMLGSNMTTIVFTDLNNYKEYIVKKEVILLLLQKKRFKKWLETLN